MPTDVHDCVQVWLHKQLTKWLRDGDLTPDEDDALWPASGTSRLSITYNRPHT